MAKIVQYYNNRYKGSLLPQQCENLEALIKLDKENGAVEDLRHIIYNMPDEQINQMLSEFKEIGDIVTSYDNIPVGELRDYQTVGVSFAFHAGNFILGDEVGLGKTVQTAGLINLLRLVKEQNEQKPFNFLMLTEKNIATQIQKEMIKFTGQFVYKIADSTQGEVTKFTDRYSDTDIDLEYSVVGTHGLIKSPLFISWVMQRVQAKNFPFDLLIIDESSVLGGSTTNEIVKAFKGISKYFKKIVFLNATPFESSLMTFYNQLNLLDTALLPTKQNFEKEYCVFQWNGMFNQRTNKYKNTEKFRELIKYFYFARTRKDKGATMSNCNGDIIYSPLSKAQKEWLKKTQMNQMIYDCPTAIEETIEFNKENVPKLKSLMDIADKLGDDEQMIVYVHFREAQALIEEYLQNQGYTCATLNGGTKQKDRDAIIYDFIGKKYKILITNVLRGLNFGNVTTAVIYSLISNPSKLTQFEGRTTRSFDIEGKNIYILCSKGAEEQTLNKIIRERAKATAETTNVGLSVIMSILLEDL